MLKNFPAFASLKFRPYSLFFWGSLLSEIGSQMSVVAINWQVYEITRSPWALGIIGLVSFIPILIFSLPAGLVVDKHDRKKVLIISQILQAVVALFLAILTITGNATPYLIYLFIALSFAARTFQGPAKQAIIPQLVPKEFFVNAISLNTIVRQASLVIGPAIGGFMIAGLGVQSIYFLNAFSFLFFILALIPIQVKSHQLKSEIEYSINSIWEGIKFVKKSPILMSTMLLDFLANFFSSATTLLPIFAKEILRVGPEGLGILYAAPSLGAVFAGIAVASMHKIHNQGKVILASVLLYGAATILFGLSSFFALSFIALTLVGVGDMISTVLRNTIRQFLTPDHLRGRMVSLNMIFVQGGPQIGEAEAGIVAALIGAPASVAIGGIATVVITIIIAFTNPQLRRFKGHDLSL